MSQIGEIMVDARGHRCPVPSLMLRKAVENAPAGAHLRLIADDPMARIDVPHYTAASAARIVDVSSIDATIVFHIIKGA